MFYRTLKRIRELVRCHQYVMTTQADQEADEDGLSVLDVENALLTGDIVERQLNRESHEWKYIVYGPTLEGGGVFVVAKFGLVDKLYILTVYAK